MKRQLIYLMIILPLLSLFSTLEVYAQGGKPILAPTLPPKPKPGGRPGPRTQNVGLTTYVYTQRYQQIHFDYTNSKASVNNTVTKLEDLVKQAPEDSLRSITWQFLGLLYLHGQNDAVKAEGAMEQAIRTKGSALVEISFDRKWREMTKLGSGNYDFKNLGKGWLKIEPGKLTLIDMKSQPLYNDKTEARLTGQQIREVTKTLNSEIPQIKITTDTTRRPYIFAARAKQQVEADLVIKLIQKHVMGKGQLVEGRR
jgi:hypothetical protein